MRNGFALKTAVPCVRRACIQSIFGRYMSTNVHGVHSTAAKGFESIAGAEKYNMIRPTYNQKGMEVLKSLLVSPSAPGQNRILLELGAGTGIQTKLLAGMGADEVIATEPVQGMFSKLQMVVDEININASKDSSSTPCAVRALQCSAEDIPLGNGSVDAVFVGQAFHWFDGQKACKEIHRILCKGGTLVLAWNSASLDNSAHPWFGDYLSIIDAQKPSGTPQYRDFEWKKPFEEASSPIHNLFRLPLHLQTLPNYQPYTRQMLLARAHSTSFINMMDDEERTRLVLDPILEVCEKHKLPEVFDYPYESHIYHCTKQ
eukprot:Nk52_evm85s1073 gene=Nk52_evmTU85s1073